MGLDREQCGDVNRSVLAHASEIVAREVDDHHVLGPVLRARSQRRGVATRALDRARLDGSSPAVALDAQEQLRRCRDDGEAGRSSPKREHAACGAGLIRASESYNAIGIGAWSAVNRRVRFTW